MQRLPLPRAAGLAALLCGCATTGSKVEALPKAVAAYNELLRWGKLDGAAAFHLPENQAAFVARYAEREDDLHIESIEVRSVTVLPASDDAPLSADVTVVAQAYLLPSTILAKTVMIQRWEHRDGAWRLVSSDRELVPPAAGSEAPAAADEPPAEPSEAPEGETPGASLDSVKTAPDTWARGGSASSTTAASEHELQRE